MHVGIQQVSTPSFSLIASAGGDAHYQDSFRACAPPGTFANVDELTWACTALPGWVNALMRLRDALVLQFGLKTVPVEARRPRTRTPLSEGATAGIFRILKRTENEILMGEDDLHLNFRFSILLAPGERGDEVFATTVVHFNNFWGRLYFAIVAPFHRRIIPAMLKKALAHKPHSP